MEITEPVIKEDEIMAEDVAEFNEVDTIFRFYECTELRLKVQFFLYIIFIIIILLIIKVMKSKF
jgi:hypothetical protein